MAKTRLTKSELKSIVQYDYKDRENYLLMPNEVIEILINNEELSRTKAPHVAFAYTYLYLITWLYRYAKYGEMTLKNSKKSSLFMIIGISETSKEYDYIIKKGGILDRLGLTSTVSYPQAPIKWYVNDEDGYGFPEFMHFNELSDESKQAILKGQTTRRNQIKEPLLATGLRKPLNNEEEYNGTFYDGGKEYTHMVDFKVFIECMTNPKLGYVAFYLYSFLKARTGAESVVTISLEGISKYSGLLPTTRDKYLKELKGFSLIGSSPEDFCLGRGDYRTEPSMYWCNGAEKFRGEPNYNFAKRKVYHVSTHNDYVPDKLG
ncbi:hypothetical protein WKH57_14300 [Niallia taxi]|uniref:hypothetical protein n=1 Tax=Niallia taxi TaxID=2499688 RepID=UPI0031804BBB